MQNDMGENSILNSLNPSDITSLDQLTASVDQALAHHQDQLISIEQSPQIKSLLYNDLKKIVLQLKCLRDRLTTLTQSQ